MGKVKGFTALVLAALLTVCTAGCSAAGAEEEETGQEKQQTEELQADNTQSEEAEDATVSMIAILKARNSLHWQFIMEGMEQTAKNHSVRLNVLWPETEVDVDTQLRMIEDAIRAKPDIIFLAPDDVDRMEEYEERIQNAGITLIYVDENETNTSGIPYVGSDNYHAGELAAESVQEILPEGSVAFIGGSQGQPAHILRGSGFMDSMEAAGTYTFTEIKEVPDTSVSGGKEAMTEVLEAHPEVRAVFCSSALICMGAQEACQSLERTDVILVGMDTQSDVLTALKNGRIHAIISQSGYEMGCKAMEAALNVLEGEEIPLLNYIENEIISKENVDDYLDAFVTEGRE